ncbi:aminotransferase class I/II-fold pyridoxal phosphate-dependent enzyme [Maribacter hydrothermalis]|uniref:8-amino-7-oxononanoate synthase n=1 Tax=Maribacter hydrothermalis TaxID=1836467 RepID=A0A1B7ZBZ8_9FLAO|nr:aminotransferase class I/II-fold pyridoxal phosphate-dependent enzyme [Maribacter hydrothermalis]APQ16023.1 8-amino-7-oxononanoate synthase [Maribacter hydrothermalis]OBR40440.1 8-amino-7-oxononanoate synthase [Maribacter hydrothermalis]
MFSIDEFPGRTINVEGKNYLYFGGTSYLGLQTNTEFQSIFIANVKKYGTAYSASRKSNIQISVFDEIEAYLSNIVGSEACITMSSGYLAGQLVCDYFSDADYKLYYAPNTHSAVLRRNQKVYDNWQELRGDILLNRDKIPVLFLDSIDFSGFNFPNYELLKTLPLKNIILVVDDSHGIGITGINGGGSFQFLQSLYPKELIVSCSLGKGFGIQAGAIFSTNAFIRNIKETQFFGGASPAMPAAIATIKQGQQIIQEKRKILAENTSLFLKNLPNSSILQSSKGHPTFSFKNELLVSQLLDNGIIVTNFRYPTENDALMSRIVLSAAHTENDILHLCNTIKAFPI